MVQVKNSQPNMDLTGVGPTTGGYSNYQRSDSGGSPTWDQGTYWQGQDGNVWVSGAQGVNSAGAYDANTDNYWTNLGYRKIADPNPQGPDTSSSAPSGSGGSGGTTYAPLNQAAVDATSKTLGSLGTILANALASAKTGWQNAKNLFNSQEQQQRKQYDESTLSNMQNYDSNLAASLRAGRSGLAGLMAALRGGGGSGNDFARRWVENTVGDTTANDIREGYNTYDENRGELDGVLSSFLTELSGKRQENEDIYENNQRAARLYDAEQRQNLFQKLAELYSDAGMNEQSGSYLGRAGNQAPIIAQNMGARVSAYDTTPIEVRGADITAFDAPEKQSMTASDRQKGSGIFSLTDPRRRERRETLAGA